MNNSNNEHDRDEISYLTILSEIATRLKSSLSLENLCGDICQKISSIMSCPEKTVVRIQIGTISRMTPGFRTTTHGLIREFEGPDKTIGRIEVYYTADEKNSHEVSPFKKEEIILLDNIASLLSGATTENSFNKLLIDYTERQKELGGIANIISILQEDRSIQSLLPDICKVLPCAWQYPDYTGARITYGDLVFATDNFRETNWIEKQQFKVPEGPDGLIEVCYTKQFPDCDEGPFLKEERNLIINIAKVLETAAGSKLYEQLITQNRERLKELSAINQTAQIITHGKSVPDTLQSVCIILPSSMQYPEQTAVRIIFDDNEYVSREFDNTPWVLREQFITIDNQTGTIEVFYLCEFPTVNEGPFLKEERDLIVNIGRLLAHFINNYKGRMLIERKRPETEINIAERLQNHSLKKQPDINELFGDRRRFALSISAVREVLFIATPYETFAMQTEGFSFRYMTDPLYPYGTWCAPRITVANTPVQATELIQQKYFDMVIIMAGLDIDQAITSLDQITTVYPSLPVYTLVNKKEHCALLGNKISSSAGYKHIFMWNNDPALLFALIKLHEDIRNVQSSNAQVILIVEDSPDILSKIITRSYQTIFDWVATPQSPHKTHTDNYIQQTHHLRPHLIAVSNYEAAVHIIRQYHDRLCCVISDIEFDKSGVVNKQAGFDLVALTNDNTRSVPCLLHSSEVSNEKAAQDAGVSFILKSNPDIFDKIGTFIQQHLQQFVFTIHDTSGNITIQTSVASELITQIENIPAENVIRCLHNGEFERWSLAQGEKDLVCEIAMLRKSSDNNNTLRDRIVDILKDLLRKRFCGTATRFENTGFFDRAFVTVLCGGSYGGKGRGVAFLNSLVSDLPDALPLNDLEISTPVTALIGTSEFDLIVKSISMQNKDFFESDFETIRKKIIDTPLSTDLKKGLRAFVSQVHSPIAVRSSSLFEDSLTLPFAGAFETYIIPNNNSSVEERLEQIELAVKLVFASLFRPEAANYFDYCGKSVREEHMAVVLQELVGTAYDTFFSPHISGVAGSFNYYPVSHMKPEDGFAVIAFGLGVYVVEGRSGHRFCPAYPDINFGSVKDLLTNSQVRFYTVSLLNTTPDLYNDGEKAGLVLLDMKVAEDAGSLDHCASVYDPQNDSISSSLQTKGPRIIDFADILKYNCVPLAETLKILLTTLSERMGAPVEIEFAVSLPDPNNNLSKPVFYLLQVKPLSGERLSHTINDSAIDPESMIMYSENALGNGVIDTITDVLVVDPEKFDRLKTQAIALEVDYFNRKLSKCGSNYVLIGPGRWGTRDTSLGVPVVWSQISNAKVIVELGFENYPLDASQGSHFFHNLTAMNTGYMAINENRHNELIQWQAFSHAELVEKQTYVKHLRFPSPLHIELDGRKRRAVVQIIP